MTRAFIGIGSNIEPATNVRVALDDLAVQTDLIGISMVYLTAALSAVPQPPYYNCVASIETDLSPLEVKFCVLRHIEHSLGRQRSADKYAARSIDLDLIVYGDLALKQDELDLPDPDILQRPFLAIPLCELAPELVLAGYGRIDEIAARLSPQGMQPLQDYTRQLREGLGLR